MVDSNRAISQSGNDIFQPGAERMHGFRVDDDAGTQCAPQPVIAECDGSL
jgi:hypothetical protein